MAKAPRKVYQYGERCLHDIVRLNAPYGTFRLKGERQWFTNGSMRYRMLLQLATFDPKGEKVRMAIGTLASVLRCGRSTAYRHLEALQKLGFIADAGIHEESGIRQWTIDMHAFKKAVQAAVVLEGGVPDRQESGTDDDEGGVPESTPSVPESTPSVPESTPQSQRGVSLIHDCKEDCKRDCNNERKRDCMATASVSGDESRIPTDTPKGHPSAPPVPISENVKHSSRDIQLPWMNEPSTFRSKELPPLIKPDSRMTLVTDARLLKFLSDFKYFQSVLQADGDKVAVQLSPAGLWTVDTIRPSAIIERFRVKEEMKQIQADAHAGLTRPVFCTKWSVSVTPC